ncbi:MAG: GntR family transcriptional regulator [Spirochaeta sp.]
MEFNQDRAIYLQIADRICDRILQGDWSDEDRLPSVRDLAVQMAVNPNTVIRSYKHLEEEGIIRNQRGIGYFTAADAKAHIRKMKRQEFETEVLPEVFRVMQLIGMGCQELTDACGRYMADRNKTGGLL